MYTIQHCVKENPKLLYDDGRRIMIFNMNLYLKFLEAEEKGRSDAQEELSETKENFAKSW